jgi:hypothetical protein
MGESHRSPNRKISVENCGLDRDLLDKRKLDRVDLVLTWGHSSVGRALQWHCRGLEFEPPCLHWGKNSTKKGFQQGLSTLLEFFFVVL